MKLLNRVRRHAFANAFIFSPMAFALIVSCATQRQSGSKLNRPETVRIHATENQSRFMTGADNPENYIPLLRGKKVGVVTNQSGLVRYDSIYALPDLTHVKNRKAVAERTKHLVDFLVERQIDLRAIYAPEHGFRGDADAGELIVDGKDSRTGISIISIYGNNKKPAPEQLSDIEVMLFDLQDVGARFYTYISTLHYIMEACAEQNIPLIVLDRPNPSGGTIDGPVLNPAHASFVGMHPIPVLHGMTIAEYALMINGEGWLNNGVQCELKIVPCENYVRDMPYSLPVRPSPNLPNDQSIALYPSLCFFEGTNVSVGRGTEKQFQVYGSPFLQSMPYSFTPMPNFGAKDPPHNGVVCWGEDLSDIEPPKRIQLEWLIKAYERTPDKSRFFTPFFLKLAGTPELQQQIESGMSADAIRQTWTPGIDAFRKIRKNYEIY